MKKRTTARAIGNSIILDFAKLHLRNLNCLHCQEVSWNRKKERYSTRIWCLSLSFFSLLPFLTNFSFVFQDVRWCKIYQWDTLKLHDPICWSENVLNMIRFVIFFNRLVWLRKVESRNRKEGRNSTGIWYLGLHICIVVSFWSWKEHECLSCNLFYSSCRVFAAVIYFILEILQITTCSFYNL